MCTWNMSCNACFTVLDFLKRVGRIGILTIEIKLLFHCSQPSHWVVCHAFALK